MANKFLISLSDVNLDRSNFKDWQELFREPDFRIQARFLDRLKGYLARLPELERDVIELYFFTIPQKKQEVIAEMLGISQQTVSHRLYISFNRIKFMMSQPEISQERMRSDLSQFIRNKFTIDVLCDFALTSSQTMTAGRLRTPNDPNGVSQQRVCWHLNSGIDILKANSSVNAYFYVNYFEDLMRNRNILREVLAGRRRREDDGGDELEYYASIARSASGTAGHSAEGDGATFS